MCLMLRRERFAGGCASLASCGGRADHAVSGRRDECVISVPSLEQHLAKWRRAVDMIIAVQVPSQLEDLGVFERTRQPAIVEETILGELWGKQRSAASKC